MSVSYIMLKKEKHYTRNKHVHKKRKGRKDKVTKKKRVCKERGVGKKMVTSTGQTGLVIVSFLSKHDIVHLALLNKSDPITQDARRVLNMEKMYQYILFVNRLFVRPHPDELTQFLIDEGTGLYDYRNMRELAEEYAEDIDEVDEILGEQYKADYINMYFGKRQGQTPMTHFIVFNDTIDDQETSRLEGIRLTHLVKSTMFKNHVRNRHTRVYRVNFDEYKPNQRVSGTQFLMDLEKLTKRTLPAILNI